MSAPKEQLNEIDVLEPHVQDLIGTSILEELAQEIGATFKVVSNHKRATDPNVLYFLPSTIDTLFTQLTPSSTGGYLFWNWTFEEISWVQPHVVSKAAVRKWLKDPHSLSECVVCFEEVKQAEYVRCHKCDAKTCTVCFYKMNLTEEAISKMIMSRSLKLICSLPYKCVQCRGAFEIDARHSYHHVFDRLSEFNPSQIKVLKTLRDKNPHFESICAKFKELWSLKNLKKGDLVVLHGLNKTEWNGKVAVIEGRMSNRNGVPKWPIELKDKPYAKAWAKECNLRRVVTPKAKIQLLNPVDGD